MTPIDTLLTHARQAHAKGDAQAALQHYQAILARQPGHAAALHGLGVLALQCGQPDQGEKLLRAAAKASPTPAILADWATALQQLGRPAEAIAPLRRAVAGQADFAIGWFNLGNALLATGAEAEAAEAFAKAEPAMPVLAGFNRGNTLARLGRHDQAVAVFTRVVAIAPDHADAQNNLGVSLLAMGQGDQALVAFTAAARLAPDAADAQLNLAETAMRQGQPAQAVPAFARAAALAPHRLRPRWAGLLSLPPLYDSEADIDQWRARFAAGLAELEAGQPETAPDALEAVLTSTAFHLNYHGRDDLLLQRRYAGLVQRVAQRALAAHHRPQLVGRRPAGRRIRVGFVSDFLFGHSITKTHGAWITDLDPARFEVFCLHTGPVRDAVTDRLAARVAGFAHRPQFGDGLLQAVGEMAADVLIYPDLGMSPTTQVLAALRLAPVQVNGLGHPVSCGLETVDWALSAALAEPPDAQRYYRETLALLPHLALRYVRARIDAEKPLVQRPPGPPVLFCAQSLFKLLPGDDALFARIAARLPQAKIWFIAHPAQAVTAQFQARLARAFAAEGLAWVQHCIVHPRQSQQGFLALMQQADVFLDAPGWSGNNSTLEALACGLPPVTLPGPMFRMRHTLAILRRIGLEDVLVAADAEDYVRRAVALAEDGGAMRARLTAAAGAAFDDPAAVEGLGAWIDAAIG